MDMKEDITISRKNNDKVKPQVGLKVPYEVQIAEITKPRMPVMVNAPDKGAIVYFAIKLTP